MHETVPDLGAIRHTTRKYEKGSYLFREGDPIKGIYLLKSGKVQIGKVTPEGRELTLKICGVNQMVGEITVFSGPSQYRLDAKAIEDTECIQIAIDDLEEALQRDQALAIAFMRWTGIDQQKTQTKFRDLLLHGKKGALYSTLIRLSNSYGELHEEGILIDVVLTNQELANFCGMTREVVNRMLSDLKKDRILSMKDGKLILHQIPKLKDAINCEDCPIYLCKID
ncbi:Crp/Fnr family transcriptional regulator [Planococcus beigongshangi]|uniref:Crp/Fnr family transcriptional regulator n=1 Tax=Planococcus beigongshangi TaxID=2782536 RepID=UPI003D7AA5F7